MLLSIITFTALNMATADIKGAYLQSGLIKSDIYVRPAKECHFHNKYKLGIVWKLTKLQYGLIEAGSQWQTTVETWMRTTGGLQ